MDTYREGSAKVDVRRGRTQHGGQSLEASFRAWRKHRVAARARLRHFTLAAATAVVLHQTNKYLMMLVDMGSHISTFISHQQVELALRVQHFGIISLK